MDKMIEEQILQAISNKKEDVIDLNSTHIHDEGFQFLCSQPISQVKELRLEYIGISSHGMRHFPKANWRNISYLNLNCNNIGNLGCKYLSKTSINFSKIWLQQNNIESAGVLHLSKGQWNALQIISLYSNRIRVQGVWWFGKANWRNIQTFSLGQNKLSELEMIQLVLHQLSDPIFLDGLNIYNNDLKKKGMQKLKKMLQNKWINCTCY